MIKWCIVGAGGIADRRTIPAILSDSNNKIVAVMDANPQVSENVAKKYNVECYTDVEEMLKREDCDCVYIATPVFLHKSQALLALKYNKHVFIEKPIGLDAEEGKEMVDAFKKAGKNLFVGYMMKYHNLHVKAKELIKKDGIGQVSSIGLQFTCWYPDIKGAWRQTKALGGGGAIMDLGVHCIELAEYILDEEIVDVKAFYGTRTFNYEVDDSAIMIFKTKSGILGHINVSFNVPDKASNSKLEIYGTKGNIICNGTLAQEEVGTMSYLYSPQDDYDAKQTRVEIKPEIFEGEKGNIYLKQIQVFCSIIEKGKIDYSYADRAVQVQKIVDKIYSE